MNNKQTNNKQKIFLFIAVTITFIIIFLLNRLYPLYWDDWRYAFVQSGDFRTERITGISDIFRSQYFHYFSWGGRVVVHLIAQLLIWFDPLWHDILNTAAYVALIFIMYLISNKNRVINTSVFVLINLLMWFFIPVFFNSILSITVSSNYVWGTLIILLFIFPYYSYFISGKSRRYNLKFLVFFFGGIIVGWTNEHTAFAMIMLLCFFCIYAQKKNNLQQWMIWGLIGSVIGYVLMIIAPGNFIRSDIVTEENISFFTMIINNLQSMILIKYLYCILPLDLIYLLSVLIFVRIKRKNTEEKNDIKKILFNSLLFLIASKISFFVMIVSPEFPFRALFGIVVLHIISITIIYANISVESSSLRYLNIVGLSLLLILFCYDFYKKYPIIYLISKTYKEREKIIEQQKANGIEDITFYGKIYSSSKI